MELKNDVQDMKEDIMTWTRTEVKTIVKENMHIVKRNIEQQINQLTTEIENIRTENMLLRKRFDEKEAEMNTEVSNSGSHPSMLVCGYKYGPWSAPDATITYDHLLSDH